MNKHALGLMLCLGGMSLMAASERLEDPYGICAHVSRGELSVATDEFKRMSEIPITWVRTDYDWGGVEKKQGVWNYSHLDKLLQLSQAAGVNILPILDYDVPWARPAYQHLDEWGTYVRKTVERYGKDIRYWEVWNEQNGFWPKPARGEDYTPLLKRSYEIIKSIDPQLTVLYGGTAGVPLAHIEATFKTGAVPYFDVMNVHPYNWNGVPEHMVPQLAGLKKLMAKYGAEKKPIWITEVGWSTAEQERDWTDAFGAALKRLGIEGGKYQLTIVQDERLGGFKPSHSNLGNRYFTGYNRIRLEDIESLNPAEYPVLMPTRGEGFPVAFHNALRAYLNKGGTVILPSGLPFYYDVRLEENSKHVQVNERDNAAFHIAWLSWWTHKGTPEKAKFRRPAPGFANDFKMDWKGNAPIRFLDSRNLKPGDELIPVVMGGEGDYQAPVLGIYKLNSDLKGNIIVCTNMQANECVTPMVQAENIPRTYILAFASGIDRVFWYNFRSWEGQREEREHHFGIVHRDLTKKLSFDTYQTLAKMLPSGSTRPVLKVQNGVYSASWSRPDGTPVCAVWSSDMEIPCQLKPAGTVKQCYDLFGKPCALPTVAKPGIVYVEGVTELF